MTVAPSQLIARANAMHARWQHFENVAARQHGNLKRHETWRHEYASYPYLLGAPDERVAARFKDVFINQTELNDEAKIGLLTIADEHSFLAKFTHLLEEYGVRTGAHPPIDVISAAKAPVLKYFANGEPIASRIFRNYATPSFSFNVKYGRREFLEPMLRWGRLRICPASYYADSAHNDAVKDDEIRRTFFIPTFRERLKGIHHRIFQGHRIYYGDDDIVVPITAPDYYLLSLCDSIYYRLPTDFDADAALIIRDPNRFAQRVISTFLAKYPSWTPHYGPVTYYDPYRDFTKMRVHQMSKHFGYAYQREVRIVLEARQSRRQTLQPEFFDIGPMDDYAELLSA